MRRIALAVLTSLLVLAATAAASADSPAATQQRATDPERGKIVLFGCGPTPYLKRLGSGSGARYEATAGAGAARGMSYETTRGPQTDSSSGTAYRGVQVGVPLGFVEMWLPERCFHLAVFGATVTCASPVFDDAAGTKESGITVAPGELVYPVTARAVGGYDFVYTHRPGVDGYVPHRCLRSGSPTMHVAPR